MIEITFFVENSEKYTVEKYEGECAFLAAELDMDVHIKSGGWCLAELKGRAVMVTNLKQLLINQ
jgi:hypothetical protein